MKVYLVSLLAIVAACGEGRAILNVDVYSFMAGTGKDTVPYVIPPSTSGSASSPAQRINLPPGFGSSIVDSLRITVGSANLINTQGTGTVGFRLYIAADSASAFLPAALAIDVPETPVSGANTSVLAFTGDLSAALRDLFTQPAIWIRIVATGTNPNALPVTGVQGRMALTGLQIRVVVQDKIL